MYETQHKFITAEDITLEINPHGVYATTTQYEIEQFIETNQITCMEFALDRLFEAEMVSGYLAEPCECSLCNGYKDHKINN